MKMMKKMLVLMMALCLVLGCAATASAATSPSSGGNANTKTNSITVKSSKKKKTYKKAKLKKKAVSYKIAAKAKSGTKVTYKKVKGCKYITVSKSGKVTIKKNIFKKCKPNKKHAVKVKITAAAGNGYKKVTKTITLKITVK